MGAGLRFGRPLNRKDGLDYCRAVLIQQLLLPINKQLANAAPGAVQGVLLLVALGVARGGVAGLLSDGRRERRRDREKLICQRRFANFVD